jgi:spore coat polysaccharide biosynthesis predicted glycosyltransferase SpsG
MKILFRVDGYPEVGLGHIIRSIAIAKEIATKGPHEISFAGKFSNELLTILKKDRFRSYEPKENEKEVRFLIRIIQDLKPERVFIDNLFPYTPEEIQSIRKETTLILFHNLCEGRFFADSFILPSAHHPNEIINDPGWNSSPVCFYHGFKYIPINEEVKSIRKRVDPNSKNNRVIITTGGSDPRGVMIHILKWLRGNSMNDIKFIALIGESFILKKELEELKPQLPQNVDFLAFDYNQFSEADLVISTFGVTSYELLYLGIPFISIAHAESNARGSKILSKRLPIIKDLGLIDYVTRKQLLENLSEMLKDPYLKPKFHKMSKELIDGLGTKRISEIIIEAQ